ncbi:hypothetical protein D3C71_486450 [compost metagenome]
MSEHLDWPGDRDEFAGLVREWQAGDARAADKIALRYTQANNYEKSLLWVQLSQQTTLRDELFTDGMNWKVTSPAIAFHYLFRAYQLIHPQAVFELDELCKSHTAFELELTDDEFAHVSSEMAGLVARHREQEESMAMLTGTYPVLFQEVFGPADWNNIQWRTGSLFLVQRGPHQFAVTARHVIDNLAANPDHFRLVLPEHETILPIRAAHTPRPGPWRELDEIDDIFAWQIDQDFESDRKLDWWAWMMDQWVRPATDLLTGQRLFATGFPITDGAFDPETFSAHYTPLILKGTLRGTSAAGLYTMTYESTGFESIDGMSGGAVFAEFESRFHYVGMTLRGGDGWLYFIDSVHVIQLLDQIIDGG